MQHGKKRTTRCAGSKCAAWLLGRLALQLATVSAWQFDSLDVQQLQLGCWTAWLLSSKTLRQVQLGSLTAWQRGFTTHQYIISFQRSGSKVWIKSFRQVWIGGLDRRSGSCVGTGLDPDLTFWAAAIYIYTHTSSNHWFSGDMLVFRRVSLTISTPFLSNGLALALWSTTL